MTFNVFRAQIRQLTCCHFKRFISLSVNLKQNESTEATMEDANIGQDKKKSGKKKKTTKSQPKEMQLEQQQSTLNMKEKNEILHFFNNCDHVTLKKFLKLSRKYVLSANLKQCFHREFGESNEPRVFFPDFENLLISTKIDESKLLQIWQSITKLRNSERTTFGIPGLIPKLPIENVKKIKYVVGVDIIRNTISWAVMTRERNLIDAGTKVLTDSQFEYNPQKHHEMMSSILKSIPPSAIYVTQSRIPIKKEGNQKWRPYQVLMEALFKLCLNHRMNLILNNSNPKDYELENFVHHLKYTDLDLFYDVMVNGEMIPLENLYVQWKRSDQGPLKGMVTNLNKDLITATDDGKPSDQIYHSIFYADIASRCLAKTDEAFPSAYFPR